MTNTQNNNNNNMNIIQNECIIFSDKSLHKYDIHIHDDNSTYGVFNFNTISTDTTNEHLIFHFMVDVSGSMSDRIDDGRSKMQLIIHTLTNMIHYFADNMENVYISVTGFDDNIHTYIKPTKVTTDNVNSLISLLSKIHPLHRTDIELALQTVYGYIEEDIENITKNNHAIVLLTDGESNVGNTSHNTLADIIPNGISSNFIALGSDHNADLMYALGHKHELTTEWFINQLENTGSVYGEIIYNETHKILYDTKIRAINGKIFDYTKGIFVEELMLGTLSSEMIKQYHILSETPNDCEIEITGHKIINSSSICSSIGSSIGSSICSSIESYSNITKPSIVNIDHDITIQYLRLGVQKLMVDVRSCIQLSKINNKIPNNIFGRINRRIDTEYNNDFTLLNKRVETMLQYVNDYIKQNNPYIDDNQDLNQDSNQDLNQDSNQDLNQDGILHGLYDDLLILHKTSKNANIQNIQLSNARETSQGRQTSYIVDDYSNNTSPLILRRSTTSAYSTPAREEIMRNISECEKGYINPNDIFTRYDDDGHSSLSKVQFARSITGWADDTINSDHDDDQLSQNLYL